MALRLREVPGPRIAETLAEVDSHLLESGEDPVEAFGPPDDYAERVCEALGLDPDPDWTSADTRVALVHGLGAAAGAWLALDGGLAWASGGTSLGLPPLLPAVVGLVVLVVLGAGLVRLARRDADPRPRPPRRQRHAAGRPWWVLPLMVAPAVLAVGVVVAIWAAAD